MKYRCTSLFLILPLFISCATNQQRETIRPKREVIKLTINNEERTLLVFYPQGSGPFPLLIAYHGHAGTALKMHEITEFEKIWSQAIVVYPQGLHGNKKDIGGNETGWQLKLNQNENRDLRLFDEIVNYFMNEGIIDQQRIYVTGQSMGGAHTFFLWLTKSDRITAFAPCAGQIGPQDVAQLVEKPFIMISGKADTTVPFDIQEKIYMSLKARFSGNQKMVFYIHNGGHPLPLKAPSVIVSFFKEIDEGIIENR
jgi:polyhydroxybutyrate depolymerase